jgi:hypothetical protein
MNQRERLIAFAVGAVILALVGWYVQSWYFTRLEKKNDDLAALEAKLKKNQAEHRKIQQASKRLAEYEERSLPPDAEVAKSLYEKWLLQTAAEVQPKLNVTITAKAPTPRGKNNISRLGFTVRTQGELPQLIDYLYRIQRVDWLHRFDTINFVPRNDSRNIDLVLNISAVSVGTAPRAGELKEIVGDKYKTAALADYLDPLIERNFFGAPNRKPQLDFPSRTDAVIDRSFEQTIKANDPDGFDHVTFDLVKSADPSAKLDPKTGKFTWRPKKKGEFVFEIAAKDDGLPNKTSEVKTFKVVVNDPPPPKVERETPKKPTFDDAKYTILTAVIDNSGVGEIWLNVRPKGENRILQVGDTFQIGSVKGEVAEIGVDDVLLLVDGKLRRMVVGQTLALSDVSD